MTAKKTTPRKRPSRTATTVQCFAYFGTSLDDVVRCTELAGHRGQHTYTLQWTDDEALNPMELASLESQPSAEVAGLARPAAPAPDVDQVAAEARAAAPLQDINRKCEACNHPFHGDNVCVAVVRGEHGVMPCDCTTAI